MGEVWYRGARCDAAVCGVRSHRRLTEPTGWRTHLDSKAGEWRGGEEDDKLEEDGDDDDENK